MLTAQIRFLQFLLISLSVLLLVSCAGMSSDKTLLINPPAGKAIPLPKATKIAALVLEKQGYEVQKQDGNQGYLFAEHKEQDFLHLDYLTYYMEVKLTPDPSGRIKAQVRSIAGPEIAFTYELPIRANKFLKEFQTALSKYQGSQQMAQTVSHFVSVASSPSPPTDSGMRKALVRVGDITVTAKEANQHIGDGLRDMLETQLFESGYFIVQEEGQAGPTPDLIINATLSEFRTRHINTEWMGLITVMLSQQPTVAGGQDYRFAHMTLDIRVTDARTGETVFTKAVKGIGKSLKSTLFGGGNGQVVGSLSGYRNTPMELAIRDCLNKSVYYIINHIPERYFRY